MEGSYVVGEQVGVPSKEAQGLRADLESLHILVRSLLHRLHEMPVFTKRTSVF